MSNERCLNFVQSDRKFQKYKLEYKITKDDKNNINLEKEVIL